MNKNSIWKIDKQFDFCYGHRVHNQTLNPEFSLDGCLKCRHLHGHQGLVKIGLESKNLNDGMVTDFKHLNWAKQLIDNWLDHKMIFDINDPLLVHECPELFSEDKELFNNFLLTQPTDYNFKIPNIGKSLEFLCSVDENGHKRPSDEIKAILEKYEGLVFVDFVPTSENLCKFIFDIAVKKMEPLNVKVSYVDYWETPKSHCRYEG